MLVDLGGSPREGSRPMTTFPKVIPSALLGVALFACSAPPPPRDTTPTASPSASVAAPDVLSPVPAPQGVVARARLKSPATTARTIIGLTGGAPEAAEPLVRSVLAEVLGKKMLRLDVDARALADEVVLDAPVDVVMALADSERPEPIYAISVAVKSLESAAGAAGAAATPNGSGGFKLGGKKARGACNLTKAAGTAPARLVCGGSERDLEVLGPYLARTLAAEPATGADVMAEIDVASLDSRFGSELRKILPSLPTLAARRYGTGNVVFDKALSEGGRLLGEEAAKLLSDVDKVTVELKADPKTGVSLDLATGFRAKTSWIAKTGFAVPPGPAPALFWKGPRDASSGTFTTLSDPAGYAEGVKLVKDLVIGALASGKIGSEAERKKVAALVDFPIEKGAVVVAFSGSSRLTKPAEPKSAKDKWQRAFAEMSGWSIVGTTLKPDAVSKWMKDLVAAFNQPGVQKALKAQDDMSITMKTGKAPAKLGKGATAIEVRLVSKVDKSDATLVFIVAPGNEGAWIGVGVEPEELAERLLAAKDAKDPLKERADLAPLRASNVTTGYFFSASTFKSSFLPFFVMRSPAQDPKKPSKPEDDILSAVVELNKLFETLPNKGMAPAFFQATSVDGAKGTIKLSLTVPQATLAELALLTGGMR